MTRAVGGQGRRPATKDLAYGVRLSPELSSPV